MDEIMAQFMALADQVQALIKQHENTIPYAQSVILFNRFDDLSSQVEERILCGAPDYPDEDDEEDDDGTA